jgi:hypothetical protein
LKIIIWSFSSFVVACLFVFEGDGSWLRLCNKTRVIASRPVTPSQQRDDDQDEDVCEAPFASWWVL